MFTSSFSVGLPVWLRGKESACKGRRHKRGRFNPWMGKIPWRREWQATPDSFLGNSVNRGVWQATVHGVTKIQTGLSD